MRSPLSDKAKLAALPLAAAVVLGACGGSSKPGYCSDRSNLEQSVKDIGNVKLTESGGLKDLQSRLQTVEANANKVVSSAKGDFPSETSAIDASVDNLKTSIQQLGSSPATAQVAAVATNAKAVVNSVQGFVKATDSKCS
jgi:hypothetical protein